MEYQLVGYMKGTLWGIKTIIPLIINTDKKGLKKIEKNPCQDYIRMALKDYADVSVKNIKGAFFIVYKGEKKRTVKRIMRGKWMLTETEERKLLSSLTPKIEIDY